MDNFLFSLSDHSQKNGQKQTKRERARERWGYDPYRGSLSTAVYTISHTLPHHARTFTYTISVTHPYMYCLYIHYVEMNSMGVPQQTDYMYINTHTANTVQVLSMVAEFRKLVGLSNRVVLSRVMMNRADPDKARSHI